MFCFYSFFQFCHLYGSAVPAPQQPDGQPIRVAPRPAPFKQNTIGSESDVKAGDEPEIITSFSYRNFFSVINFVHVLQKLTKRKPHRILLLVQYKSSVSLVKSLLQGGIGLTSPALGHTKTYLESLSSSPAAICSQSHQEPDTLLRSQVEAM